MVSELLDHAVLEKPMHQDHVGPAQLLAAGHVLAAEPTVMRDELEVEARDEDAGVAVALGRPVDRFLPAAKREVRRIERVEQHRGVDPVAGHVHEDGVSLDLAEVHGRRQGSNDRVGQVLEDVLRVVELGPREVRRVAADIGQREAARLGLPDRRMPRDGRRHPSSVLPHFQHPEVGQASHPVKDFESQLAVAGSDSGPRQGLDADQRRAPSAIAGMSNPR